MNFSQTTVTIEDNDTSDGVVELASAAATVNEGAGLITLTLNRSGTGPIDVEIGTMIGSANGSDFGAVSPSTLSWAANESGSKQVSISIINDMLQEADEDFLVNLSLATGSGGTIGMNFS